MEEKKTDPFSWQQKTLNKIILPTNPELSVSRGVGNKASLIQYGYDELIIHVSNKINQFDYLKDRESSFIGRMQNKLTGAETETIELDGIVIQQLTALAGETLPFEVKLNSTYKIKHMAVKNLYGKAKGRPDKTEYDRIKGHDWRVK